MIEWVKSNRDKEILGYTNHFWNGITCLQFAKVCEYMIDNNIFWSGVKHVISPNSISKYNLVRLLSEIYNLNIKVKPFAPLTPCNRILITMKDKIGITIPTLKIQLIEQKEFLV